MTVITEAVPRAVAQTDLTRIEEALDGAAFGQSTGGTQRFGTPAAKLPTCDVVAEVAHTDTAETVGQRTINPANVEVRPRTASLRVKSNTQTRRGGARPHHTIDSKSRPRKINEGRERTPTHTSLQEAAFATLPTAAPVAPAATTTADSDSELLGNRWGRIPTAHRMPADQKSAGTDARPPLLTLSWPLVAFLGSSAAIGAIYYLLLNG